MKHLEILGITKTWFGASAKMYPEQKQIDRHGRESIATKLNDWTVLNLTEASSNGIYYVSEERYCTQGYA